ncbi:MAG: KTSC domain-containing protein [Bacteroidetes bacterium]|nr:KTSC domain-containing protein [Bacteroidota bacterium]MBL7103783.1 KTSC domain-containing protein [Bacteroidales bacterium]
MALPINIDELLHGHTVEWDRVELKKGWNPENIIHSLCAYANDINNWDGGYIIVGVEEENGKAKLPPVGLKSDQLDVIQKKLIELSFKISPAFIPVSQPYIKDGKHILIIWAPAGDNRPYKAPVSLSEKKSEKAWYIKRGSKTLKVKDGSEYERRLLELTARIPFDDRINQGATLDNLSLQLIQSHLKEVMSPLYNESTKIHFQDLCKQMKIAKGPDENLRPTNVGLLLFNEHPDNFFAGAKIELVLHKGKVGKDYVEKIFTGPIVKQVRDVLNFINTNIIQEQVSKSPRQAEAVRFFNYPYQAIEEVLVNAVYHRSYERENPVEIQIHPDKIEILSFPGPIPPVDKEMLKKERIVTREYRNRKLGGFLKELKLTEGRGTGFPIIYNSLEINGSPRPIFETDDNRSYFLSTIKIHTLAEQIKIQEAKDDYKDIEWIVNSVGDINNYLSLLVSKKRDIDKSLAIKSLNKIHHHLRLLVSRHGDEDKRQHDYLDFQTLETINRWIKQYNYNKANELLSLLKSFIGQKSIDVLELCLQAQSREAIFERIQMYNNTKNYNKHIKPLLAMGWILYTLPDKPNSKKQKYIISESGKTILKNEYSLIKRIPVHSSNVASVGYDENNQILEIEFHNGAISRYFDVPQEVFEGLMSAGSLGSYFMYNIKNEYEYQKI